MGTLYEEVCAATGRRRVDFDAVVYGAFAATEVKRSPGGRLWRRDVRRAFAAYVGWPSGGAGLQSGDLKRLYQALRDAYPEARDARWAAGGVFSDLALVDEGLLADGVVWEHDAESAREWVREHWPEGEGARR